MLRKALLSVCVLFLLPALLLAQDGKLRGKVTDKETGDALIGANVVIEGTTTGAVSDLNGDYIILRVPPGTYVVKSSYIGYAPVNISNIIVNAGQTTTLDFQLPSAAVEVAAVNITAERPLVQRNTTNTVRITTQDDVKQLPIRGTQNILALQAGVVQQDGVLYVRGGRAGEVAYFVDGASTTNRRDNTEGVAIIQEAYQELQIQPGGFTAEYGGANSGVTTTTIRTGGSKMNFGLDYRTDDFAKPGEQFLGTSSFGYKNLVANIGGPIESMKLRYFFAGQYNYLRSPIAFFEPFSFENISTDINDPSYDDNLHTSRTLPGTLAMKENYLNENSEYIGTLQGTLLYMGLDPITLKLSGSYNRAKNQFNEWNGGITTAQSYLVNIFNQYRRPEDQTNTMFLNLRATHQLNPKTFYEVGVAYYDRDFERADTRFGSDFLKYPDSLANAAFDGAQISQWRRRYRGPDQYITGQGFGFNAPGTPVNFYQTNQQRSYELSGDLVSQVSKNWEVKVGGRFESWNMRQYNIANIAAGLELLNGINGNTPGTFADEETRRVQWARQAGVNNYGYDVYGNKVDGGVTDQDAPKKPLFYSAYWQNKIEFRDLVLNLGLRYEAFNPNGRAFNDPTNIDFDENLDIIEESALTEGPSYNFLMPRINFSFPVTDKTVFYAAYGKYAQMPSLNNIYTGFITLSRTVSPTSAGNAFLTPIGFYSEPERLTQYEVGFRQQLGDVAAFTLTGFYKDTRNQLAVRKQADENGNPLYTAYLNRDFGTIKGLELTLDLRRTKRLSGRFNLTLQDARGTGSNPQSSFGVVETPTFGRFPSFITPLEFNQPLRGTMLLDYRFGKGDGGSILQGLGAFALFNFTNGHNYTKIKEPESLGQADAYEIGIYPLTDTRFRYPIESLNTSTTPPTLTLDLTVNKMFYLSAFNLEIYANVLNLLNSQNKINVYPNTGTAEDDGWLNNPLATQFLQDNPLDPGDQYYQSFYRAFNLDNRYHYQTSTGNDLLAAPRQIRLGVRFEY